MRKVLKFLGAGAMAAALSMVSASAQDFESQVRTYLDASAPTHASRGYSRVSGINDVVVPLTIEGAYLFPVNLRAGVNYRAFGVCDDDCTDVDMEVYGADGQLVDRDIALDDTPFVQITPTQTGRAYVRIWLANCTTEPCYVAARVVGGGNPEERQAALPAEPAEGGYEQVVTGELDAAGAAHLTAGFSPLGDDVIAPVRLQSEGHRQTIRLQSGRPYIFQGSCDQDCSNVDMELLDARGQSVVSDVALDDRPVLRYTPTRTGDYSVRVWLASCSVEPCYIGLRSYGRTR
jgi:hypothetical protein